jgi:hypothetical protein
MDFPGGNVSKKALTQEKGFRITDRWQEVGEVFAPAISRPTRPELIAQEGKLLVLVSLRPVCVLAISKAARPTMPSDLMDPLAVISAPTIRPRPALLRLQEDRVLSAILPVTTSAQWPREDADKLNFFALLSCVALSLARWGSNGSCWIRLHPQWSAIRNGTGALENGLSIQSYSNSPMTSSRAAKASPMNSS